MELRPRKGCSAQSPSTSTISKPSPRKLPAHSALCKKSASVPPSPILMPPNEDTNSNQIHDCLALLSPVLREENHKNSLLVEGCLLSDFIKSGRKSEPSAMKQKKKAASAVKKKSIEMSSIAEQDTARMEEFCTANDCEPIASEMINLDDAKKCDEIAALDENEAAEAPKDNVLEISIELGEGKSVRKSKKLQLAKSNSTRKGGRGSRLSEETSHGKGTDAASNEVNDQEHTLVAGAPGMPISDECHHLSLVLSDDENAPILSAVQMPMCEKKDLPSTSGNELHVRVLKTSGKKKTQIKRERFTEESINRRLFEETPATTLSPTEREPHDHFKHETCKLPDPARMMSKDDETKKVERSEEIASSNDQCCKPYSEGLKETDQTDTKVLNNDDVICVKPDAAVDGKILDNYEKISMKTDAAVGLENGEEIFMKPNAAVEEDYPEDECICYDVSEETSEVPDVAVEREDIGKELFSTEELSYRAFGRDEEIGYVQDPWLNETKGDAVHHDQYSSTDNDNDDDVSSGSDEDESNLASMFASSMKAHLYISESSLLDKAKEMQTEQDAQRGESPFIKDVVKGSHANGSISRLSSSEIRWLPKVTLSESKNHQFQGGTFDKRPATVWEKYECLQDGLCLPPVGKEKLKKLTRKQKKDTTGDKWYNLSAPVVTPELKKELQLVKLRGVLDPKRHYKAEDSKGLPKYFQVGTVIGGPMDFYSGRMTKKERKSSLANELLSDSSLSAYRKRKFLEIQDQKQAGGKGFWKKKKNKRTPAWAKI